jgi:predicted peptidase
MIRISFLFIFLFSLQVSAYNIDQSQISVSGLSSGAYMAGQLHVAYSDVFMGVGIIAGGPFYCAQSDVFKAQTECMGAPSGPTSHKDSVSEAERLAKLGSVAPLKNLVSSRVFILTGQNDSAVVRTVVDEAVDFYKRLGVSVPNIEYVTSLKVGHAFATVDYGNECETPRTSPFISRCNYDTAVAILKHIYGNLKAPVPAIETNLKNISQKKYTRVAPQNISLADQGYAYIPTACDKGARCKLHVVLHGCKQTTDDIGDQFYTKTGYNEWAESNNIVMIYPQTIRNSFQGNPNGCWDWWGYTSRTYHGKEAPQMLLITKMIEDFARAEMRLR